MSSTSLATYSVQTSGRRCQPPFGGTPSDPSCSPSFDNILLYTSASDEAIKTCLSCGHASSDNTFIPFSTHPSYPTWPSIPSDQTLPMPLGYDLGHHSTSSSMYPYQPVRWVLAPSQPALSYSQPSSDQTSAWCSVPGSYPYPLRGRLPPDSSASMDRDDRPGHPDWINVFTGGLPMVEPSSQAFESSSIYPPSSISGGLLDYKSSNNEAPSLGGYDLPSTIWLSPAVGSGLSTVTSATRFPVTEASEALEVPWSATNPPKESPGAFKVPLALPEDITDARFVQSSSGTPSESTTRGRSPAASPCDDSQPFAEVSEAAPQRTSKRRKTREASKPGPGSPADRPFRCPDRTCGFSARYLRDVTRHLASRRHGPDAAAPTFPCAVPGCAVAPAGGFSRFDNFQRHMRGVHDVPVRAAAAAGGAGRGRRSPGKERE